MRGLQKRRVRGSWGLLKLAGAGDKKERGRMSAGPGVQIQPSLATNREAQRLLAKYFAPTRLIHAPFLGERVGKNVYVMLETELPMGTYNVRGEHYALGEMMKKG